MATSPYIETPSSSEAGDREQSSIHSSIPNPPNAYLGMFATAESLEQAIRSYAKDHHFNIARRGYSNVRKGKNGDGLPTRIDLICDQGHRRKPQGVGLRATRTKKSRDCPWRAKMIRSKATGWQWVFEMYTNPDGEPLHHNHGPTPRSESHFMHRQLGEASQRRVEESVRDNTSRPAILRASIRKATQGQERPTLKDINNIRQRVKRRMREGFTATQAFIRRLRDKAYWYKIRWANDDPATNKPVAFFWTMPYCVSMWQRYPQVLSIDNTYKTNRFKMPFFSCTGQTGTGSVFNRAFGLTLDEKYESCLWLIECLAEIQQRICAPAPKVVITDFDEEMKRALKEVYLQTQQQICIFHINKNITGNVSRKWKSNDDDPSPSSKADEIYDEDLDEEDRYSLRKLNRWANKTPGTYTLPNLDQIPVTKEALYELWEIIVYTPSIDQSTDAWELLCNRFSRTQGAVVKYLHDTYIEVVEQWASCYTHQYLNYGVRTTSPTETSHKALKSFVLDGKADLLRLQTGIEELLESQEEDYQLQLSDDILKIRQDWIGRAYLGNLPGQVTRKALSLINTQYKLANLHVPTPARPRPPKIDRCICSRSGVRAYLGIYCYHEIYESIKLTTAHPHVEPLTLEGVDSFWHAERPLLEEEPDLAILDPPIAVPKGRPATGTVQTLRQALQRIQPRTPTAYGRASKQGGGLAPSQRRVRSHWEVIQPSPTRIGRPLQHQSSPTEDCIEAVGTEVTASVPKLTELRSKTRGRPHLMMLRERTARK